MSQGKSRRRGGLVAAAAGGTDRQRMAHETTLVYTEPLVRSAVFAFWRRTIGPGFSVALVVLAASLASLVFTGQSDWFVGATGAALGFGILMAVSVSVVHYRSSISRFRKLGSREVTFRADESTFSFESAMGTTTFQWSIIRELWQFPKFWLVLYTKAQFNTVPLACMSREMQDFVRGRIQAAGGKVDDSL